MIQALDQARTLGRSGLAPEMIRRDDEQPWAPPGEDLTPPNSSNANVGGTERIISVAAGAILGGFAATRRGWPGLIAGVLGGGLIVRGATGYCPAYAAMNVEPPSQEDRGTHVEQTFIINRTPEELYSYWRNFENLPNIMTHLKEVRVIDARKSHWVAKAPRIVGGSVEWDAEVINDEPNRLIAWRSLPVSQVDNAGAIRFAKALGDRGTEVHVFINYVPPAGIIGHAIATAFGENPRRQMRDDLRNFKRLMETGEIPTTQGQSRGMCSGRGKVQQSM